MEQAARALAGALAANAGGRLLIVSGAGISRASGIPTFRGSEPEAVWRRDDLELATRAFLLADPVTHWRWYLDRFAAVDGARPNPAHDAVAALERWQLAGGGDFLLVTQNIDCLHEAAGSRRLVKVHGTADRVRCTRSFCRHGAPAGSLARSAVDLEAFRRSPASERLPRCPACGALLRAHVLFFDEYYLEHRDYEFDRVERAAAAADLVVFIGTSFSVGVTDVVLRLALGRRAPIYSLDPAAPPAGAGAVRPLRHPAEELLPAACRALGAGGSPGEVGTASCAPP